MIVSHIYGLFQIYFLIKIEVYLLIYFLYWMNALHDFFLYLLIVIVDILAPEGNYIIILYYFIFCKLLICNYYLFFEGSS